MRVDCKFYESRTYKSGDTVRMCRLDMAPEAPWRCPENCPKYERKLVDGGWTVGSLANSTPEEPPRLDDETAALLDSAEDIINAIGPQVVAEVQAERSSRRPQRKRRWWWPFS
jgi:hypothetical protein